MKIFIDKNTGKIKDSIINAVPLSIVTDIKIFDMDVTEMYSQCVLQDGSLVYVDSDGNRYLESDLYEKNNEINDITLLDDNMKLDESIFNSKVTKLDILNHEVGLYKYIDVNEQNAKLFELSQILNVEFSNIIDESDYTGILYSILTELDLANSTFKSLNNLSVTLGTGDYINIVIENLTQTVSIIQLFNLDTKLGVYVNNSKIDINEDGEFIATDINSNNITLEIRNDTDSTISICNPYILYI